MALITMYLCTDRKREAAKIFESMIDKIKDQVVQQKIVRCEPYWKRKYRFSCSTIY